MNVKMFLKALGYAILALIFANTIYLLIELYSVNFSEHWTIAFKHGTYKINENLIGLKMFSAKANGFMLLIFVLSLLFQYKKIKSK